MRAILGNDNYHYRESEATGESVRVVLNVPLSAWPAAEPLVRELKSLELGANEQVAPSTNRQKVRALIRRCELVGREIRVKDVIAVADVDESLFFKWQRGEKISGRARETCEKVVGFSPREFILRLSSSAAAATGAKPQQ